MKAAERLHKSETARTKRRTLKAILLEKQERLYTRLRRMRKKK